MAIREDIYNAAKGLGGGGGASAEAALVIAEAAQAAAEVAQSAAETAQAAANTANTNLGTHTASTSNPHGVTKSQVGLGKVNNNTISMSLSGTTLTISYS